MKDEITLDMVATVLATFWRNSVCVYSVTGLTFHIAEPLSSLQVLDIRWWNSRQKRALSR